jgi:hypothetical protein
MNSREKGKRGERQWRDELRANGLASQARLESGAPSYETASRNEVMARGGNHE